MQWFNYIVLGFFALCSLWAIYTYGLGKLSRRIFVMAAAFSSGIFTVFLAQYVFVVVPLANRNNDIVTINLPAMIVPVIALAVVSVAVYMASSHIGKARGTVQS